MRAKPQRKKGLARGLALLAAVTLALAWAVVPIAWGVVTSLKPALQILTNPPSWVPSPATLDYEKLDWLNGVYLRTLQPEEYAHWLDRWLAQHGIEWRQEMVHATVPVPPSVPNEPKASPLSSTEHHDSVTV